MSFTYTDRNAKTVLHSWGRFRGAVEEAVVVGDLLAIKEDADSGFQLANVTSTQTAVAVACQDGEADQTIWMAMIAELKAPTTISTGGVATQTYFAASGDTMGSAVYLSTTDGKLSSSAGAVVQVCGYIVARDRVLVVPTTYLSATSLAISGALTVGTTAGVTGNATFGGTMGITGNTTVGGTLGVTGATTLGSTVALSDNATFATNKKLYFRSTSNYICSTETNVIDIYSGTQCVIRSPACVVVGAFTAVSTSIFCDAITIADDKKLYFDDTNAYIQASSSGNLALWASATIYLTAAQGIWVFDNITMDGQTRIRLGTQAGGGTYICSHTAGGVIMVANSALSNAIILQTNEGGSIQLAGYLLLDTIATEGTVTGQMWYCTDSGGVIEYYANSAKRTLQYTEP